MMNSTKRRRRMPSEAIWNTRLNKKHNAEQQQAYFWVVKSTSCSDGLNPPSFALEHVQEPGHAIVSAVNGR
jgi:hypothetical protein